MEHVKQSLFGPTLSLSYDDQGSEGDDETVLQLAEDEDPIELIKYLRTQLKNVTKAYKQQVKNTIQIVKRMRNINKNSKLQNNMNQTTINANGSARLQKEVTEQSTQTEEAGSST